MYKFFAVLLGVLSFQLMNGQTNDRHVIWNDGIRFIKHGDFLMAAEKMNQYLTLSPYNPSALFNRGVCLLNLGDQDGGCLDLTIAQTLGLKHFGKFIQKNCDPEVKLKILKKQFYKGLDIYADQQYRPIYTRADTLRGSLRPERNCFDVYFYDLTVRIKTFKKEIEGKNEIWFKGKSESSVIQIDLFNNFDIKSITLDGPDENVKLNYSREFNAIFIKMPEAIQPGKNYKISIEYSGKPRCAPNPPWDGGFVWSRDKRLHRWVSVACEQLGASSWWPNKDHLSDKPDSMAINIEVPRRYQVVSNGQLRAIVHADKKYDRYEWFVQYPINNYNATFYMGKYSEFTDTLFRTADTLILRYHVLPYHLKKARQHFKQAKDVVGFYSDAFGEYPFLKDCYGLVESSYEGMEHQNAIAYGEGFDNAKNDRTYLSKKYDFIIVHETAHEWWGNSVTAGDMADLWIHEGFATYAEYLFLEHELGYEESMAELHNQMKFINNVWPVVQNRDVNENEFAGNDVYFKGAMLLQCLRATMNNDSLFKSMLKNFHLQYRFKIVNSDDFISFVNNYTRHDYTPLFKIFLYETRLPVLEYEYEQCDTDLILKYKWTGVADGFEMPFSIETTDDKIAYRIMATTTEQEIKLANATSFAFFNLIKPPEGCPHNGLTYYWTKCRNFNSQ